MLDEKVFTVEEVSEYLRVPVEVVLREVAEGRLEAMRIAGFIRIDEPALVAYKNQAKTTSIQNSKAPKDISLKLKTTADFSHVWPDGKNEKFTEVQEGVASYLGREYHIKLGFTNRQAVGTLRRRCVVLVDRYPTVEFVGADTNKTGMLASIIRNRQAKQVTSEAMVPQEYQRLPVGGYREIVNGTGAPNGLAVICKQDDFQTMVRHALIRHRYREERD